MKKTLIFIALLFPVIVFSQTGNYDNIQMKNESIHPSVKTDKMYNFNHHIYFNGHRIDTSWSSKPDTLTTYKWQYELPSNFQNSFTIPFKVISTSIISYNGMPLRRSQWSGVGTSTITLSLDTREYDYISIIQ